VGGEGKIKIKIRIKRNRLPWLRDSGGERERDEQENDREQAFTLLGVEGLGP
jgi:hypothetical protein